MRLDMVGIVVSDMAKAIEFYEVLGFKVIGDPKQAYVELTNQGVRISLNTRDMIAGIYGFVPESQGDKIELAFLCETPAEVNEVTAAIKLAGYEVFKEPWDAFWGQRYVIIKDLDGNLLSLFANLETD
ncbi:VOC family protein [uncultured Vagococcus sp.]|uniref:VOC family protein n=1 Tax=uncultured Vagococcus sp. TaxID=189676 RepID=UPI0028D8FFF3|nr:VOC family protein [uncultured Vagococcus sp.]